MRAVAQRHLGRVLLAALSLVGAACGGSHAGREAAGARLAAVATSAGAAPVSSVSTTPCQEASLDVRAATVLFVGIGDAKTVDDPLATEVAALGVGGVTMRPANIVDAAQVRTLVEGVRQRSPRRLLVGVDEEGGRVSRLRGILGSSASARTLGQRSLAEIADSAAQRGAAMRRLGFDMTFAPVADADGGPPDGPIGDRSFGTAPADTGARAAAYAAGLERAGVLAVAKHFPGQGELSEDSHAGSVVSEATVAHIRAAAAGFQPAIDGGVPAVMVSHVTFTAFGPRPATLEPAAYSLLRSLGFDGVAITDSLGMGAIVQRWPTAEAAVMALAAGADMVLANQGDQASAMRDAIVAAVSDGRLSRARLDEAVERVLTLRGEAPDTMVCH